MLSLDVDINTICCSCDRDISTTINIPQSEPFHLPRSTRHFRSERRHHRPVLLFCCLETENQTSGASPPPIKYPYSQAPYSCLAVTYRAGLNNNSCCQHLTHAGASLEPRPRLNIAFRTDTPLTSALFWGQTLGYRPILPKPTCDRPVTAGATRHLVLSKLPCLYLQYVDNVEEATLDCD